MKRSTVLALSVTLALVCFALQLPAAEVITVSDLARDHNAFATDLYSQLRSQSGNLLFSPLSISAAMGMAYGGARGETEVQMAKVMHFSLGQDKLHLAFSVMLDGLKSSPQDDYQLNIANRLWGQAGFKFRDDYIKLTEKNYGAAIKNLDFAGNVEDSRSIINKWVAEQTKDKIKDLMPRGSIESDTRMALTNAIYFHGNWVKRFDPKGTRDAPFYAPGKEVKTPMMGQTKSFRYAAADGMKLLELPYKGNRLSMIILLPDERDGLPKLEESFTTAKLDGWIQSAAERSVVVSIPKFKLTSQFSLAGTLRAMGMTLPFGYQADFSGMDNDRDLYISAVIHKAFVDVNEEGTEAAAATGSSSKVMAAAPAEFRADHPFIFLIRDNQDGGILFLGRVNNPSQ
jgi:serine protease inhibitor